MINQETYRHIQLEHLENGVLLARLNRPERLNAINDRLHVELARLPADADMDPEVNVLVLAGSGRAFCAGGDMKEPLDLSNQSTTYRVAQRIVDNVLACEKPIIAATHGSVRGLGVTIALLCDVVLADTTATFADTHVHLGAGAGDGGQLIWPLLIGVNRAKYYLMTGDVLTATQAERLGLVNFVVQEDVVGAALELAMRLSQGSQKAVRASKVAVNAVLRSLAATILPLGLAESRLSLLTDGIASDEAQVG